MSRNIPNKLCMIFIYVIIIILVPLFLDYLFRLSVRRKRKLSIMDLARKKSAQTKKPLLIFNDRSNGIISHSGDLTKDKEEIQGEITEIIGLLKPNSFVIVVSETLEYVDNVEKLVDDLNVVSGSDLYIVCLEKNSPRIFCDYKIKNIMDSPFYIMSEANSDSKKTIKWSSPTNLQTYSHRFYSHVFKIIPYNFFVNDPIV